jgi:hypothetical protein
VPQTIAGPWKASAALMLDRSAGSCARSGGTYSLDLTNDTLAVDTVNGRMFTVTVPADGTIKQSFKSPNGPTYEMVGNARTRDLEVVNNAAGCRWKLTPDGGLAEQAIPTATPIVAAAPPPPKPVETKVAAAAPTLTTAAFDGNYRGGLQLGALSPGNSYQRVSEALRSIEVHVANGEGIGTVRQQRCSGIGAVNLKAAPNGTVTGEMDALETDSCAPLKVRIDAKVERELITGVATNGKASVEFSLRKAN